MRHALLPVLVLATCALQVDAGAPSTRPSPPSASRQGTTQPVAQLIAARLSQTRARLEREPTATSSGASRTSRDALQDLAAIRAELLELDPLAHRRLFREASLTWRLAQVLDISDPGHARRVRQLLREHPEPATMLLFSLAPESDDPEAAFEVLEDLCRKFSRVIDGYPGLAAAVCVVRDTDPPRHPVSDDVEPPAPDEIFAYFVEHERRLASPLRAMPPELLIFLVDAAASIPELEWSLGRYARQANVGARFFDVPYDYNHFRTGQIKEVSERGYSLPNLQKFGGVCADQAYFAAHVGKSIGIPSAIVVGSGAESSHAWIAFLEIRGQGRTREIRWNMESGRYDAYKGVRGTTRNPQTNQPLYEGELRVLADLMWVSEEDRLDAIAFADMAGFEMIANGQRRPSISAYETGRSMGPPPAVGAIPSERLRRMRDYSPASPTTAPATPRLPQEEQLLRRAVELSPACLAAWRQVQRLGGSFTLQQKDQWADLLQRLCGRRYPDFAIKVLRPMIASLPSGEPQDRAWESAMRLYGNNVEVAADIRLAQAQTLYASGESELALRRCDQIVRSCAQAGPRVVEAVALAEQILLQAGRQDRVVDWYGRAFEQTVPPGDMAGQFARQSAWYRIGSGYARCLREAGNDRLADKITRRLRNVSGDADE